MPTFDKPLTYRDLQAIERSQKSEAVRIREKIAAIEGNPWPWDPNGTNVPPGTPHPMKFHGFTGKQFKKWRKKHGFSRENLCEILKVNIDTLSRWEQERSPLPKYMYMAMWYVESLKHYFFQPRQR